MKATLSKYTVMASLVFAAALTFSCSNDDEKDPPCTFSDSRDGKTYKCAEIGTQTWMAEDLKFNATGSSCLEGSDANCAKYGKLYDWATALDIDASCNDKSIDENASNNCGATVSAKHKGICPEGWHIPSTDEWDALGSSVDESFSYPTNNAGTKLKAKSGWGDYFGASGNGTDDYGFAALPSNDGSESGEWWTSDENSSSYAYRRNLNGSRSLAAGGTSKARLNSVRCIKD